MFFSARDYVCCTTHRILKIRKMHLTEEQNAAFGKLKSKYRMLNIEVRRVEKPYMKVWSMFSEELQNF
jgi:hypothetical protein